MHSRLLIPLLVLTSCGVDLPTDELATSEAELAPGCTNPITCPTAPGGGGGTVEPDWCAGMTGTLRATPTAITLGQSLTLSWQVTAHSRCTAPVTLNGEVVARTGSKTVTPLNDTQFQLTSNGATLSWAIVPVALTQRVFITSDGWETRRLFARAIATPNTTVVLRHDLDLNLTDSARPLPIAAGVTIVSESPPAGASPYVLNSQTRPLRTPARDASHLGPRIYATRNEGGALFYIASNNVTLRGFRLQGPAMNMADPNLAAISIVSAKNVEIDNLEISGWPRWAVGVNDPWGLNDAFDDVRVHDCFIHHNQCPDTMGYGVMTGSGAMAHVYRNVFDWNRHAIASGGAPLTGYFAEHNLVLRENEECASYGCSTSQQFDVHGSDKDDHYNSGPAGMYYLVTNNAFQFTGDASFKLRGTPSDEAVVMDNVFAQPSMSDAIQYTEVAPTGMTQNVFGRQTLGQYGVCDFDGDGRDDLFLASGRNFWFASAGTLHWNFLSAGTESLSQLGLGDFDHDGRCDLLRANASGWQLSSGGRGAWSTIPNSLLVPLDMLRFHDFDGDGFTDIFYRDAGGVWWVMQGTNAGLYRRLGSSDRQLSELLFGDFDGDRITDIMSVGPNGWQWSRSGTASWAPWASRFNSFDGLIVGEFDGLAGDDVLRITKQGQTGASGTASEQALSFSSRGQGAWTSLGAPLESVPIFGGYRMPVVFTGRFGSTGRDSALGFDTGTRLTSQLTFGQNAWLNHAMYQR